MPTALPPSTRASQAFSACRNLSGSNCSRRAVTKSPADSASPAPVAITGSSTTGASTSGRISAMIKLPQFQGAIKQATITVYFLDGDQRAEIGIALGFGGLFVLD